MFGVTGLLLLGALILLVVHAASSERVPLWPAVLLLIVAGLLGVLGR
jgi:hypothetical protein